MKEHIFIIFELLLCLDSSSTHSGHSHCLHQVLPGMLLNRTEGVPINVTYSLAVSPSLSVPNYPFTQQSLPDHI